MPSCPVEAANITLCSTSCWCCVLQAPPGCQSDVWHRVPKVLLNAVQSYFEVLDDYEADPDSVARMADTAAGIAAHAVDVMSEQQEEVQELQQQLAESRQQLAQSQEQVGALQQQLQAMRAQLQLQQQQQH